MKKFMIEWETDYCEDGFVDFVGSTCIKANDKDEAIRIFRAKNASLKALITDIYEIE